VEVSTGNNKPYKEELVSDGMIRTFEEDVDHEELVWHRDKKDRAVVVLEGNDWQLQFENQLPIKLEQNKSYYIKRETFHRVLKGKGLLKVSIKELD
jgi:hypothetical protein